MDLKGLYGTATFNHDFGFREYITPNCECDPKKQIMQRTLDDYKNRPRQGKFKVTTKPRVSYFDELAKPNSAYPAAPRYKVEGDLIRRTKSASIKKVMVDLKVKRGNYIDNMEEYQSKHKPPGVGKFDLTKFTDFGNKRHSTKKLDNQRIKNNNFDDAIKLAGELPGPGQFNPHKTVVKLRKDRTDMAFWKKKHESQEKKSAKSISTKLGPATYDPIPLDTFAYTSANKAKPISRWSHGTIDIRKGLRSQYKDPSPSQYNTVHQWVSTGKKDKQIGNLNVFNRVSSARSFGVYH